MSWEGECNRCGLCCTQVIDNVPTRCEHLQILSADEAICGRYLSRRQGMAVALLDAENRLVSWDICIPSYPHHLTEKIDLPAKCGYRWVIDNP